MPTTVRILSIDGGGVRGIIPATVLATLERIAGRPVHELFDLISGTSTGGIIAAALAGPNPPPASDIADLYIARAPAIFAASPWRSVASLLSSPKYSATPLEVVLRAQFGDRYLSEARTNLLIPSYDIERREAKLFKSWHAASNPLDNFLLRDVCRATSAAPTYFEPAMIRDLGGRQYACVDGSVYANNPTMCAVASARRLFPAATRLNILSLGVGEQVTPIPYREARTWGALAWARPAINIMLDGLTETVDYQLREAMGADTHYVRIQTRLGDRPNSPSDTIDDASSLNIERLIIRAQEVASAADLAGFSGLALAA